MSAHDAQVIFKLLLGFALVFSANVVVNANMQEPAAGDEPGGPLDSWRSVHKLCEQAVKGDTAADRIRGCEEFLERYPDHKGQERLLQTLLDAYVETGSYEPERVCVLLETLAEMDPTSIYAPLRLIDEYYLKHGLPLESAGKLFGMSSARLEKERAKLERETDPKQRRYRERTLAYYEASRLTLEGQLLLEHGENERALKTLLAAEEKAALFPRGVAVYDGNEQVGWYSTGVLDTLGLGLAVAYSRLGDKEQAAGYRDKMLGFFSQKKEKELRDELHGALELPAVKGLEVTTAPQDAPDFVLKDLEGNDVRLSEYRGKVVLISFWATWCYWCIQEIPVLRKFEEEYRDKGVIVLALNTDSVTERSQIKPFIEEHNMPFKVILGEEEKLTGYEHSALPTLYVVDREGRIALASVGYDSEMKEKLETKIASIIEGGPTPDRPLVTIERAPEGFGVIWQAAVEGDVDALAVAPKLGERAGEIGAVGRQGLMRWSADGSHIGDSPVVVSWARGLQADDLDADGRREWILVDYNSLKVFDDGGERYWNWEPGVSRFEITSIEDLDGEDSGQKEMVLKANGAMVAIGNIPESRRWRNDEFKELQGLTPLPDGGFLAQVDDELRMVTGEGRFGETLGTTPEGFTLSGRVPVGDGGYHNLFAGRWDDDPLLDYDVDGDGRKDIVIGTGDGLVAYDATDGSTLLRVSGDDTSFVAALGDLGGGPGDEVVLFVRQYGIVVLGRIP